MFSMHSLLAICLLMTGSLSMRGVPHGSCCMAGGAMASVVEDNSSSQWNAAAAAVPSCCRINESDSSKSKTAETTQVPAEHTPAGHQCPGCPRSCCLATAAGMILSPAQSVMGLLEAGESLVAANDQIDSRCEEPLVPPPKVMLAA